MKQRKMSSTPNQMISWITELSTPQFKKQNMKSKTSNYPSKARSSIYAKTCKSMLEVSDNGYGESILAITTI